MFVVFFFYLFFLKKYVLEFSNSNGLPFSTNGKMFNGKLCCIKVGCDRKLNVQLPIGATKHKAAIKRKKIKI